MASHKTSERTTDGESIIRFWSQLIHIAVAIAFLSVLYSLIAPPAQAQTETILHSFACGTTDGCYPQAGVVLDSQGNLYGTTYNGGANNVGTVFKLTPSGAYTILHSFACTTTDGCYPEAGVVLDSEGNFYGTTLLGGLDSEGTVFEVSASGAETILYNFTCETDGCEPQAGLVFDKAGNLYGATPYGGVDYGGNVFKLVPSSGVLTTLYSFTCGADGCSPQAGVVLDSSGNLYGTTYSGGASGFGTVFKVTPSGTETVLHSFTPNGQDGFFPEANVVLDSKDNVYSTTNRGGKVGLGTVFRVTPSGAETVYSFGGADGISPASAGLVLGKGNVYGATFYGGTFDLGIVFELSTSGTETILHNFDHNGTDGYFPYAGPTIDSAGNLYGTTYNGGSSTNCGVSGCGTVFKIVP